MILEKVEYVKVDKYVIKNENYEYDAYWNVETEKWGGLLNATQLPLEEIKKVEMPDDGVITSFDKMIGIK